MPARNDNIRVRVNVSATRRTCRLVHRAFPESSGLRFGQDDRAVPIAGFEQVDPGRPLPMARCNRRAPPHRTQAQSYALFPHMTLQNVEYPRGWYRAQPTCRRGAGMVAMDKMSACRIAAMAAGQRVAGPVPRLAAPGCLLDERRPRSIFNPAADAVRAAA
ncbi:hypothetical protein [Shinella zoogloeoides]|uniref:hypothetical protein n=1 Tax=Shinella zoogloeoides TaxID=352475 RepID=UPI00299E396A|nr:hypothetical protein [Shinella zoogloeoides]